MGVVTPRVAFVTLGCPKNEVDSDRMLAATTAAGYLIVDDPGEADAVVVNTCSFIKDATEESISVIFDLLGEAGEGVKRSVIVAGCMPSRYGSELAESMPEVAAFLPVAEQDSVVDVLSRLTGGPQLQSGEGAASRTVCGATAYLQIADGCHRTCAYCTIPSIRGPYVSRTLDQILTEARELVGLGAREIILIGQDITEWGRDLPGAERLADVVDAVAKVEGVEWLRLMYAQPDGVDDALLSVIAANPNVCRYLDMPLQHASAAVLRRMHRRGDGEQFLDLIAKIRTVLPDVVLRTTLIAGFPGETRQDARELEDFIARARFDYVGVFTFSPEDGTEAATMPDQVPLRTRRARAQRLRDLADSIGFEKVAERVGGVVEVLVEGVDPDDGVVMGRWRGQAPDIDGVVLMDRGTPGEILSVSLVDSLGYDLEGEVV